MFQYLSFRGGAAVILALLTSICFGKRIIRLLQRRQIGEEIRNLGLEGQLAKKGTPTMGGLIILAAILIPVLLLGDLKNVYVQLMLISTVWLGLIGFADDYIKVFRKNKEGLKGRLKIAGQAGLGIIVGAVMCHSSQTVVRETYTIDPHLSEVVSVHNAGQGRTVYLAPAEKTMTTTIPFVKGNQFDYHSLIPAEGGTGDILTMIAYIIIATFIIVAVSNGANLTDGLDGLAAGVSAVIVVVLGILAYLSGNMLYSDYLNLMYLPGTGEIVIYAAAFAGALTGFIWYNCYPAQVFMGDTGSLAIGGIIAVMALMIRTELLLPILCGVFLAETASVIVQTTVFKIRKRRRGIEYAREHRVFLMAPLHHHYQKSGYFESKIVVRMIIVQILLAAVTLVTLKMR
jgi:phospho-N-acetylmuramoyl-pentapeptide-transferase